MESCHTLLPLPCSNAVSLSVGGYIASILEGGKSLNTCKSHSWCKYSCISASPNILIVPISSILLFSPAISYQLCVFAFALLQMASAEEKLGARIRYADDEIDVERVPRRPTVQRSSSRASSRSSKSRARNMVEPGVALPIQYRTMSAHL